MKSLRRVVAAACLLLTATVGSVPQAAAAPTSGSSVTLKKTVTRTFTDAAGKTTTVGSKKVTLTVDRTTSLRSLELIHVTWSGAQPTGAITTDQNLDTAMNEEYPFAIFECRGTDTAAHPITPETCWTQYGDERFADGSDDPPWPAWRADSAATPAQRTAVVNSPPTSALPAECRTSLAGITVQRWVPFRAEDGTTYPGGPVGCAGLPPEGAPASAGSGSLALPSNETFGVTDAGGSGGATFDVFTNEDHASLGCSTTVACSLVAVPIMGLSCDPAGTKLPPALRPDADGAAAAADACEAGPNFAPGSLLGQQQSGSPAVDGQYWWSPSNWANRMTVPLSFAPADNGCALDGGGDPVDIYGSELMTQASTQWAPRFCLDPKLFNLTHVQTPEPQARTLLTSGAIEAAYTSDPPDTPYPNPTVNAPVAVTGFGIGYTVDDASGKPVTNLRLDARLLAKLLTESYPSIQAEKDGHPGMQNNPLNITDDPEFQALNPGIGHSAAFGAATLLALNTDSDVMYALTSYINADPEARAWLNGAPDPWGMVVNPSYQQIKLPVDNWPLLDSYEPTSIYKPGLNDCLYANPVPYLPLVAAPISRLYAIAQDLQYALSQSQTSCVLPSATYASLEGARLVAAGRQTSGHYIMFGVVSLGDAKRNGLDVASLGSYTDALAPAKFTRSTSTQGRSFVAPTDGSLAAAAKTLRPQARTGTWPIPYSTLRTTAADSGAYPGTMVVYAAVPTQGLPNGDGARYADVLRFAAGAGQVPGIGHGQLPAGFLPMTAANSLGQLVSYTRCAANAVQAQQGTLPSLTGTCPKPTASGTPSGGSTTSGSSSSSGSGGSSGGGAGGGSSTGTTPPAGGTPITTTGPTPKTSATAGPGASSSSTAPSVSPHLAASTTRGVPSGVGGWVLPVLLILGLTALIAGLIVRVGLKR